MEVLAEIDTESGWYAVSDSHNQIKMHKQTTEGKIINNIHE